MLEDILQWLSYQSECNQGQLVLHTCCNRWKEGTVELVDSGCLVLMFCLRKHQVRRAEPSQNEK